MIQKLKRIWQPALYHGHTKKGPFFEGWFFKVVNPETDEVFAFIPGIFLSPDKTREHAFIQVLDGRTHQSTYHRYPVSAFSAAQDTFDVTVGESRFFESGMELQIDSEGRRIEGSVSFEGVTPWPVTRTSPGIMGWYAFAPLMQCYHGVPSLDHTLHGSIMVDGRKIDFESGRGYIEKDWGKAFPSAYVWMQCNHFETKGVCLSASVARIPWVTGAFRGFIVGLLLKNRLLRFTTYTGARVQSLRVTDTHVHLEISDSRYLLEIEADRAEGGLLHGPYERDMTQKVSETLRSTVDCRLSERTRTGWKVLFEERGSPAGLDVNGELQQITTERR